MQNEHTFFPGQQWANAGIHDVSERSAWIPAFAWPSPH
jgi:hypothetical protein